MLPVVFTLPLPCEGLDGSLHRSLLGTLGFPLPGFLPALREALTPGGVLLYETFTEHQRQYDRGPRSSAHLLAPGELRRLVSGLDLLFDEEVMAPDAVARVAARKR